MFQKREIQEDTPVWVKNLRKDIESFMDDMDERFKELNKKMDKHIEEESEFRKEVDTLRTKITASESFMRDLVMKLIEAPREIKPVVSPAVSAYMARKETNGARPKLP